MRRSIQILKSDDEIFTLFVLDLFSRDGDRPRSMEAAAKRKNDLMFGNQTFLRLKDKLEIRALKRRLSGLPQEIADQVFLLVARRPARARPRKILQFFKSGPRDAMAIRPRRHAASSARRRSGGRGPARYPADSGRGQRSCAAYAASRLTSLHCEKPGNPACDRKRRRGIGRAGKFGRHPDRRQHGNPTAFDRVAAASEETFANVQ